MMVRTEGQSDISLLSRGDQKPRHKIIQGFASWLSVAKCYCRALWLAVTRFANLISGFLHLQTDNQLAKHCTGLNSSLNNPQLASVHVDNGIRRSVVKIMFYLFHFQEWNILIQISHLTM